MLNDKVCRAPTDKQTHKYIHKHTYWVKTEETFFYRQVFYLIAWKYKRRFPKRIANKIGLKQAVNQKEQSGDKK